jgi:Ca2+-binding RTX toxin-like protein
MTILGTSGNDAFRLADGGSGAVSGGKGGDLFAFSGAAVRFDATLGTLKVGSTYTAAVTSIGSAHGSEFGDVLTGGAGYNFLAGQAGNDVLTGGAGADALVGGSGSDRASYASSSSGVMVSLTTGKGTGGDAEGHVLAEIESLNGSAFADALTGNSAASRLQGGNGADTLRGMGGADTLTGGNGADCFVFASVNESGAAKPDVLIDFNAAQNGLIRLVAIDANTRWPATTPSTSLAAMPSAPRASSASRTGCCRAT